MAFLRRAALAVLIVAAACAAPAFGQPPPAYPTAPPPIRVPQPPAQTQCSAGVSLPPAAMAAPAPTAYPPSYSNPYGYPSYQGPVGGALSGAFLQTAALTVVTGSGVHNPEVAVDTAVIHVMTGAIAGAIAMFAVAIYKKG